MTVMADEVLLRVTKRIKSSLEKYPDSTILNRIKQTEAGEVIEYGYLSQVFTERQRCGKLTVCSIRLEYTPGTGQQYTGLHTRRLSLQSKVTFIS